MRSFDPGFGRGYQALYKKEVQGCCVGAYSIHRTWHVISVLYLFIVLLIAIILYQYRINATYLHNFIQFLEYLLYSVVLYCYLFIIIWNYVWLCKYCMTLCHESLFSFHCKTTQPAQLLGRSPRYRGILTVDEVPIPKAPSHITPPTFATQYGY